jgi:C4-dicarboxylate-specific signal transduction histidine kinase
LAIEQLEAVRDMLDQMEPLYYSKRRSTELLNVGDVIRGMKILYTNTMKDLNLDLEIIDDQELIVKINKGHLMQVFNNLFDNSFFWLNQRPTNERPRIVIKILGKSKTAIFADNGPGVDEKIRYRIFEPFVSSKPDGRGLGLFIVQDILQTYKGDITLLDENKLLLGANFKITFPGD